MPSSNSTSPSTSAMYCFFHFMLLELAGELRVRLIVLDRDHQPRGFLVQTVHDPRAHGDITRRRRVRLRRKIRKLTAMEQKRVDQRPGIIPLRRMNEHAGRFIDDQQEFVFVKNIQRDILGGTGCGSKSSAATSTLI